MAEVSEALGPGLFTDDDPPRLVVGRCPACHRLSFPLQEACPYCAQVGLDREEVAGDGRLWAWTAVTAAPPGYRGPVPYGFGVVELDAGLRVLGRLTEADPGALSFGQEMALVTEALLTGEDQGGLVYAFAPSTTAGSGEGR
jgi:uncharacterized OB-fold protein